MGTSEFYLIIQNRYYCNGIILLFDFYWSTTILLLKTFCVVVLE